ncbi:unnamed protein product [Ceratitis capitata]|uniref:(Mediterranean fruit fly) hypothetical protein n=1 Tax=Ceratitis capitata TaxID=7213 RepID=A0A811V5P6_CERCA|nr:unnamed protein product [Ceratitis capitata]
MNDTTAITTSLNILQPPQQHSAQSHVAAINLTFKHTHTHMHIHTHLFVHIFAIFLMRPIQSVACCNIRKYVAVASFILTTMFFIVVAISFNNASALLQHRKCKLWRRLPIVACCIAALR